METNKIMVSSRSFLVLCSSMFISMAAQNNHVFIEHPNFYQWKTACDKLPHFDSKVKNPCKTILKESIFSNALDMFFQTAYDQFAKMAWVDDIRPFQKPSGKFEAYVEKLIIPNNATVAIHGDIHGDIHAINRFIEKFAELGYMDKNNPFKIAADNFYILFLGDYVDRGWYGIEVIYAVLRLKSENPDRVFMVRGNHEDLSLNSHYGFCYEIEQKFASKNLLSKLNSFYNFLPLAIYLGSPESLTPKCLNIVQCCHGGIELGFNPGKLIESNFNHVGQQITTLMQKDGFDKLVGLNVEQFGKYFKNNIPINNHNGFMWSDFIVESTMPMALSSRDGYRGSLFEYGSCATKRLLKEWSGDSYKLRSIFRAHQHGCQAMQDRILNYDKLGHQDDCGVGKLWIDKHNIHKSSPGLLDNVAVVTFSVAPESGYGWPVHAFGQLDMAPNYSDWRLKVVSG